MAELIISVHIPKTGGSSFKSLLGKISRDQVFFDYDDRPLASGYSERRLHNLPQDFERCNQAHELIRANDDSLIFIHGHFVATKYSHIFPEAKKYIWLRDPVERLASHYYYWRRVPDMKNDVCVRMVEDKLSLEEFASLPSMQNIYDRFLDNQRINRFDFVGITEEYSKSVILFSRVLGAKIDYDGLHVLKNPDKKGDCYNIGIDMRRKIESINKIDCEIYKDAKDYFNKLCIKHDVL